MVVKAQGSTLEPVSYTHLDVYKRQAISGVFAGFLIGAYKMVRDGRKILKLLSGSALVFLILNVGGAFVARLSNIIPIAWEAHLFGFLTGMATYPFFYWMVNLETKTELS